MKKTNQTPLQEIESLKKRIEEQRKENERIYNSKNRFNSKNPK